MDDLFINGPINITRLEGKIGTNKKVIYLFGDVHLHLGIHQNKCTTDDRLDIDVFLAKKFKENKNIKYDLFIESSKTDLVNKKLFVNKIYKYILSMRQFINKNFITTKSNVVKSEKYPNVRFHYFDIRDQFNDLAKKYFDIKKYIHNSLGWSIYITYHIYNLCDKLLDYDKLLKNLIILLDSDKSKEINKIKNKYYHKDVENILTKYFQTYLNNIKLININKLQKQIIRDLNKHLKSNKVDNYNFIFSVFKKTNKLNMYIMYQFTNIVDIYLLRRILDKDYINNSIVYTGYYHFIDIMYILVNEFNFKITHSDKSDINKLKRLLNRKEFNEIRDVLYKEISANDTVIQCSNFKNFPQNMT